MIKDVTLVAVSSIKIIETLKALIYSNRYLNFERVLFLTDVDKSKINNVPNHGNYFKVPDYVEIEKINKLNNKDDYSKFMLYELKNYIKTRHIITIQHDGFILHPDKWDDMWLNYDFIGAPWPPFYVNRENVSEIVRIGNGGFSLRSKKFINLYTELNLPLINDGLVGISEDHQQCCMHRNTYINNGIKFAPVEVAKYFSHENHTLTPETTKEIIPFGFHLCRGYIANNEYDNYPYPTFN